jgi:hypothetical protein
MNDAAPERPHERLVGRLRQLADSVTQGRDAVAREFTMRVPAEPERDADLVLSTAADELDRLRDEIEALESKLRMIANAFEDWQEPTPGAGREWCERFSTYLRGTVMASACFTPDEWAEVKKWMAPNARLSGLGMGILRPLKDAIAAELANQPPGGGLT